MTQIKAGYGRAASVREKRVVVDIEDIDMAFAAVGYRESVVKALIGEAQKIIDAGAESVPGFQVELRAFVR